MAGNLSSKLPWDLANPKWAATLNPILSNPIINGRVLSPVVVTSGDNVINHGLSRQLQGWIVVLNNAAVTFYDKQATNQYSDLTLILTSSGVATVTLYVF